MNTGRSNTVKRMNRLDLNANTDGVTLRAEKPPMSDKRFDMLIKLAAGALLAGTTIACTAMTGVFGLLCTSMISLVLCVIAAAP